MRSPGAPTCAWRRRTSGESRHFRARRACAIAVDDERRVSPVERRATLRPMDAPHPDLVERWAWDYVTSTSLATKLAPPAVPTRWEDAPPPRKLTAPGRPEVLRVRPKAEKIRALTTAAGR